MCVFSSPPVFFFFLFDKYAKKLKETKQEGGKNLFTALHTYIHSLATLLGTPVQLLGNTNY